MKDEIKQRIVANAQQMTPERMAAELSRHAEEVKEQIKKLEKAKFVSQQTMQMLVTI